MPHGTGAIEVLKAWWAKSVTQGPCSALSASSVCVGFGGALAGGRTRIAGVPPACQLWTHRASWYIPVFAHCGSVLTCMCTCFVPLCVLSIPLSCVHCFCCACVLFVSKRMLRAASTGTSCTALYVCLCLLHWVNFIRPNFVEHACCTLCFPAWSLPCVISAVLQP